MLQDGLINVSSAIRALSYKNRARMLVFDAKSVACAKVNLRIARNIHGHVPCGRRHRVGHRVCESHDVRRELGPELLRVVSSI